MIEKVKRNFYITRQVFQFRYSIQLERIQEAEYNSHLKITKLRCQSRFLDNSTFL